MEADVLCSLYLWRSESFVVFKTEFSKKKGPGSSSCDSSYSSSCIAAELAECSKIILGSSNL